MKKISLLSCLLLYWALPCVAQHEMPNQLSLHAFEPKAKNVTNKLISDPDVVDLLVIIAGWQPYRGSIPPGAIEFREVDQPRYVCRANYNGGKHPGKVVGTACNIGWGGREVVLNTFEILVDTPARPVFSWQPWKGLIHRDAVFGGVECTGGENCNNRLFFGMGTYQGYNQQVGKILSRTKALNFGYGGVEIANMKPAYILVMKDSRFAQWSTCIDSCVDD